MSVFSEYVEETPINESGENKAIRLMILYSRGIGYVVYVTPVELKHYDTYTMENALIGRGIAVQLVAANRQGNKARITAIELLKEKRQELLDKYHAKEG